MGLNKNKVVKPEVVPKVETKGRRKTDTDGTTKDCSKDSTEDSIVDIDVAVGDKHIDVNVKTYPALVTIGIVVILVVLLPLVVACTVNSGDVIHANQYNGSSSGAITLPYQSSEPIETKETPKETPKEINKEDLKPQRNTMFILAKTPPKTPPKTPQEAL
jgi:hypothetical protein